MTTNMFLCDFSGINANHLRSFRYQSLFDVEPWQSLDLSILEGLGVDFDLKIIAQEKFELLKHSPIQLTIIDTLALISVDNNEWQDTITASKVSTHWWESILNTDIKNNKSLYALLSLILQSYAIKSYAINSNNSYATPAIKSLIKTLINNKITLQWYDKTLKQLVYAIIENKPSIVAQLAFYTKRTVSDFINDYRLPIATELKKTAQDNWLGLYFKTPENELKSYSTAIQKFLLGNTTDNMIQKAIKKALMIFNHSYFSKDLNELEQQTHKFNDIHRWLKKLNGTPNFVIGLDNKYRQILRVWLGAGNYYELRKIVEYIAEINREVQTSKTNSSISLNRYLFWQGFQSYIVDYWLLVPTAQLADYRNVNSQNIKPMTYSAKYSEPVILLRFDNYYFIQPLVKRSYEVDLIMTKDVKLLDTSLTAQIFDSQLLYDITPCLIHDHAFLWQPDMARTLKEYFNIQSNNPQHFKPLDYSQKNRRLSLLEEWIGKVKNRNQYYGDISQYTLSYNNRYARHGN